MQVLRPVELTIKELPWLASRPLADLAIRQRTRFAKTL
jgi:hypothetical protein